MPEVDGLAFHHRGQSSQYQVINGAVSASVIYTYLVQGLKEGNYTIPPIPVNIDGSTHATSPISCTVTQAGGKPIGRQQPSTPATMGSGESEKIAFIRVIPEKSQSYVGEIIPAKIKAYFYKGIKVNLISLPSLQGNGVLLNPLGNEPLQQDELVNNRPYTVLTWETTLTGIKEGQFDLSMEMDATLLVPSKQRRQLPGFGSSFFQDDFFNDFLTSYENRPIRVASPPVSLSILTLPEQGKPDGFTGAIGNFTLNGRANPTKIATGEPITLTMTIQGSGNFDNVQAPKLSSEDGLKTYTPSNSFSEGSRPDQGVKTFEQAVVITDPKLSQLPPVVFSYFDPQKDEYQTLFSDPVAISVQQSAQVSSTRMAQPSSATPISTQEIENSTQPLPTLAPAKLASGNKVQKIKPIFLHTWFLLASAVCLIAIVGVSGYRMRKNYLNERPTLQQQKLITHERKALLKKLSEVHAGKSEDYLKQTQANIAEFLALLWHTEPTALTAEDIRGRLGSKSPITELFIHSDQAKYGAISLPDQERERLHNSLINTITTLS